MQTDVWNILDTCAFFTQTHPDGKIATVKDIDEEISSAEEEINKLKTTSGDKITKIAIETSSDLIKQLIGVEVNNSSISAIVEDVTRKTN